MSEIVNLRRARKARKRAEERDVAAARAAAFGEGKAARSLRRAEAGLAERRLEQHRVDADPGDGDPRDAPEPA